MKNLLIALCALPISTVALAQDTRPPVQVQKDGGSVSITITGPAAQSLYDALDVEATGQFGLVQVFTKQTTAIQCKRAILGDIPGQMSEAHVTCVVTEATR